MNDIFSFKRFWYLLIKEIFEKRVFLLGMVGVTSIVFLLIYVSIDEDTEILQLQIISLFLGIIMGSTILVSYLLGSFSEKKLAVRFFVLPSSFFERWFCVILVTFFIYVPLILSILYFIDFYYINELREMALAKKKFSSSFIENKYRFIDLIINLKSDTGKGLLIVLSILTSAFTLGALYFNKLSYYKTALLIFLVFLFFVYGQNIITSYIVGEDIVLNIVDYGGAFFTLKDAGSTFLKSSENISFLLNNFVRIIFPLGLWLIALLRFKEKEF
jgi:hypothetical protein